MDTGSSSVISWTKYLVTRILILFLLYKISMQQGIYSYTYGYLKTTLHELGCHNEGMPKFCLLKNPFFRKPAPKMWNCSVCESIHNIKKVYDTSYAEIQMIYQTQNTPVVVTDAMFDWPTVTKDLSIYNITEIYRQPQFHHNIPCKLITNINLNTDLISDFLDVLLHPFMEHWFIFWKNCDLLMAKAARHFYRQPYFIEYFIPAAKMNWVLMSSNYKSANFKEFKTEGNNLVMLMQLRGSQKFKLTPYPECIEQCSSVIATLEESQILVFNSELWHLWYSFGETTTSIAILVESDTKM